MITTQAELRRQFWKDHPELPRKLCKNYEGNGKMFCTDTRCAFVDYVDMLAKDGQISEKLAEKVTL